MEREAETRRYENSSGNSLSVLRSRLFFLFMPFFMQKKVTNECKGEREEILLIFGSTLLLSPHSNPFVTIFCSNKPFLCTAPREGAKKAKRMSSYIFNLSIDPMTLGDSLL
jgi:hypothetical protein